MSLPITKQRELLKENLIVVPINADLTDSDRFSDYKEWVADFYNSSNLHLTNYIYERAWLEDARGETRIYLVLDKSLITEDGKPITKDTQPIVFYFGLKCGQLSISDTPELSDYEETFVEYFKYALLLNDEKKQGEILTLAPNFFKNERIKELIKIAKIRHRIMIDRKITGEENKSILVTDCFPAVEVSHFVKNENYTPPEWLEIALGEYIFWEIIAEKIQQISEIAGLQYVYLFAAEGNPENPRYLEMMQFHENRQADVWNKIGLPNPNKSFTADINKLIRYYEKRLHFSLIDDKNIMKPVYDYACYSMVQSMKELRFHQKSFWERHSEE